MRANPFHILLLAVVCIVAPASSWAHTPRRASHPAKKVAAPARHGKKDPASKAKLVKGRAKREPRARITRAGRATKSNSHLRAATRRSQQREQPRGERNATRAAVPEPAPELPPIHVSHNRHRHLAPVAPPPDSGSEQPRKATNADFLSVGPAPAPASIAHTSPAAGVAIGSRIDLKPVPQPEKLVAPEPLVALYDKRGRLIVPPAMKGSHEVLLHQNTMADSDGLERIQDDEDLNRMRANHMLVALPESQGLQVDERLPENRRYSRPWTAAFLSALAKAHSARFHSPLQVNSAVRTVEFQQRLLRTNGNAAPVGGETASPHLTGQAVDIAKHGLSLTEIAWLRGYLLPLVQEGKVDVEEEFQQACFHISVYKRYLPQASPRRQIAPNGRTAGSTLAIAIP